MTIDYYDTEMKARAAIASYADELMLAFACHMDDGYNPNWHHQSICNHLDAFTRDEIDKLMIFMPPQTGKSQLVSRYFPGFTLGQRPDIKIISASYSYELAQAMNRDVQRIIDNPRYPIPFPNTKLSGQSVRDGTSGKYLRNSDVFEIVNYKGYYRSAGVGGGITGHGADIGIIDDPIKNQKEAYSEAVRNTLWGWYTSTFFTRLQKRAKQLIINTRWHEDDLCGRILSDPELSEGWTVLSFPMIKENDDDPADPREIGDPLWPQKYDLKRCIEIQKTVGEQVWNALYQQRPSAQEGGIIKRAWLKDRLYTSLPSGIKDFVISADLTFKDGASNDFVCIQVWGKKGADLYLIDQIRDRMGFMQTISAFQMFAQRYPAMTPKLIEDTANGPAMIDALKKKVMGLIPIKPNASKSERLQICSPLYQAGNIHYPHPSIAPWVRINIEELVSFPNSTNDDTVDASTQAITRLSNGIGDRLKALTQL